MKMLHFFLASLVGILALGEAVHAQELLPPDRPIEQAIDHYVDEGLQLANVKATIQADDATFIRRVTLDLNGRVPTYSEVAAYLTNPQSDKKIKLVERLLASPAFARHQLNEFEMLLASKNENGKRNRGGPLRDYLLAAFAENRPWDQIFRELITADESDPKKKGASDFLRSRIKEPDRLTSDVSSLFFGVNISCAQCHDHPLVADWKQDHFYGMKSFFARTVEAGTQLVEKDFGIVKYIPNKGKEKVSPILFLTGTPMDVPGLKEPTAEEKKKDTERVETAKKTNKVTAPAFSLRAKLVEEALKQRVFFSKAVVNRMWNRFYGLGLVSPLDQMHSENSPSHPELLEWLARDLAQHGYDLKRTIRGLVLSQAYSRSSRWDGEKIPPAKLFAYAQVRPLTPSQMAVSLRLASYDPNALPSYGPELEKKIEEIEKNATGLTQYFSPPAEDFSIGVSEALLFSNSDALLKESMLDGKDRLVGRLKAEPDLEKRSDLAVRAILGRPARSQEMAALADYQRKRSDRPAAACQQVVWALLTSAEFRFNP